jgi:hypothetical protein
MRSSWEDRCNVHRQFVNGWQLFGRHERRVLTLTHRSGEYRVKTWGGARGRMVTVIVSPQRAPPGGRIPAGVRAVGNRYTARDPLSVWGLFTYLSLDGMVSLKQVLYRKLLRYNDIREDAYGPMERLTSLVLPASPTGGRPSTPTDNPMPMPMMDSI